jgi:membrane-associated PAP2 superfamily phosphatase
MQGNLRVIDRLLAAKWNLGLPLAAMTLLCFFSLDEVDYWFADAVSTPGVGFPLKGNVILKLYLHDEAKHLIVIAALAHLLMWFLSFLPAHWMNLQGLVSRFMQHLRAERKSYLYVFLAMALSTGLVTELKSITGVQCPWSITRYGGDQEHSSFMAPSPATASKVGECWPAGHASRGFSLFALFFAWRDRRPQRARAGLALAITVGLVFSVSRMLQGAHFFSHNIWSALICWTVSAALYYMMLYQPSRQTSV